MNRYAQRRIRLYEWLERENTDAAYLVADPDVRYFTGMPSDSVLILLRTGRSILLPWDINLANVRADADEIIPYTEYHRDLNTAVKAVMSDSSNGTISKLEIPGDTAYPSVARLRDDLTSVEIVCRSHGLNDQVHGQRIIKDADELSTLEKAAEITNRIFDRLESDLASGELQTELDVALFLEREARSQGAEGTGFESIVAGPTRSNGIHAFPSYTNAPFAATGCGIIDFGVKVDGYTSDITLTAVFGEPRGALCLMLDLVQQAYDEAIERAIVGADAGDIARHVDAIFEKAGYAMPHSLGHGIGLEVHEAPGLRSTSQDPSPLKPGMVFTIEPGLYHPTDGGVRLENDVMLTEAGARVITHSRILHLSDPR